MPGQASRVTPAWEHLSVYRYEVRLSLERPLREDAARRSILWRGAFGEVFRALVCHDVTLACAACPLRTRCPFSCIFSPAIPPGRPDIARLRDPPRPFVLHDPRPEMPELPAKTALHLSFSLVGSAVAGLPYFVVTLRRLGECGLGRLRTRFDVLRVQALSPDGIPSADVYAPGGDVRLVETPVTAPALARPGDEHARRIRVRFRTPTDARGRDEPVGQAPTFGTLLRRARDRASALATFFGTGPLFCDPGSIGAVADEADRVAMLRADVTSETHTRRSRRTGERHPLEGVVGSIDYEGVSMGAFMPWLRLAEVLGVGRHATFGQGQIDVNVLG